MNPILRAIYFAAIIVLGYILRKIGVFKKEDFKVLSNIVLKLTLPATVIVNFAGKSIEPSLLLLMVMGLGFGIIYMIVGHLTNKSFGLLNLSGYNIGNFALPFIQNIFGPAGVIATSVFDVGNACVCLGGSYGIAASLKGNSKFSYKKLLKAMVTSVPLVCYVVMIVLSLVKISLPSELTSFVQIIANANVFLGMLMLGIGIDITAERSQIKKIAKILSLRYGLAVGFALGTYFLLPFSEEVRKVLLFLVFSPVASAAPAYTEQLGEDTGLASAINSISIFCSVVIFVAFLLIL